MYKLATIGALVVALAGPASASSIRTITGHFPIDEHIAVLEPESTLCGFPISLDFSGQGTFEVFFDAEGNLVRGHILEHSTGTLSANGIEVRDTATDNRFFDLRTQTLVEVGLVFRDWAPGVGVVLMDRGRLIWNLDDNGEMVDPPIFEAGPHPELHGDLGELCAVLTP